MNPAEKRDEAAIDTIVIHHSYSSQYQTIEKSVSSFSRSHKAVLHPIANSLGTHVAYHYVIAGNGEWKKTRGLHERGHHASNWDINGRSVGICMTGNFDQDKPSKAQLIVANYLIKELGKKYSNRMLNIRFHSEFAAKTCPGLNVVKQMFTPYVPIDQETQKAFDSIRKQYGSIWDKNPALREYINKTIAEGKKVGVYK